MMGNNRGLYIFSNSVNQYLTDIYAYFHHLALR
uniref:Uncharacterized protein n=1 Tax=Arundo donax TaxID=35708 RepID=A0A0A8YHA1_ARUDO